VSTWDEIDIIEQPPEFPDGVDAWDYLRDCYAAAWNAPGRHGCSRSRPCDACGACYRRTITRYNPVAFAVTYLSHLLRQYANADGVPVWSFSPLHLDLAGITRSWARPGPHRDIVVGPRDGAKSIGWIIGAVWAIAHGHREYLQAFSHTREQIIPQLADVRLAFESDLLLADFPELAPRRGPGGRNTMSYVTVTGATIAGHGLGESYLGARAAQGRRPDMIVWDDAEGDEVKNSPREKRRLLAKLRMILPMNIDAAVLIVGVPSMAGALVHDAVRRATGRPGVLPDRGRWVDDLEFTPHYWPALLDEGGPAERSLWPQKWSRKRLRGMAAADPLGWAMNYRCDPSTEQSGHVWAADGYRRITSRTMRIDDRAISIDGAVTTKSTSNHTAIVVGGQLPDPRKVLIEHAEQGKITGLQLRERVWDYCERYPRTLHTLLIEVNQGGDRNLEVLDSLPTQLTTIIPYRNSTGKRQRIEGLARRYHRGAILHVPELEGGELEDQQCLWVPGAEEDDLLDADAGLVRWFLDGWPGDPSAADRRLRAVE
jgi:hypothetical protein